MYNEEIKKMVPATGLRSWVQLPPGPLLSIWLTTVLNHA